MKRVSPITEILWEDREEGNSVEISVHFMTVCDSQWGHSVLTTNTIFTLVSPLALTGERAIDLFGLRSVEWIGVQEYCLYSQRATNAGTSTIQSSQSNSFNDFIKRVMHNFSFDIILDRVVSYCYVSQEKVSLFFLLTLKCFLNVRYVMRTIFQEEQGRGVM